MIKTKALLFFLIASFTRNAITIKINIIPEIGENGVLGRTISTISLQKDIPRITITFVSVLKYLIVENDTFLYYTVHKLLNDKNVKKRYIPYSKYESNVRKFQIINEVRLNTPAALCPHFTLY